MELLTINKALIKKAFKQLMGAIIRLALRNGVNYVDFSQLCKWLYVDIAANEYGIKGRKTNISRIALITGLDRKEIKRITELEPEDVDQIGQQPDKLSIILSHWSDADEYTDAAGQPMELMFEGGDVSFAKLVNEHGGGSLAPITVLREFKRSNAIEETADGKLRVLRRDYIPNYHTSPDRTPDIVDPEAINHGSSMLVDHINTIFHNLYRKDAKQLAQLDMRATNPSIKLSQAPEFYQLIDKLGMKFLHQVDQWLEANAVNDDDDERTIRLGVGVYSIEGDNKTVPTRS